MSDIDRQRISGVKLLESQGYRFHGGEWHAPPAAHALTAEADAMHVLLVTRANALEGCTDNSPEATELLAVSEAIEAYEAKRWPLGREARG